MNDYSYLGSGKFYLREYGSAEPFVEVGNCSAINFNPQTNAIVLADHTQPGGGTRNRVDRVTEVQYSITFHDFAPENFARFLRGTASSVVAGTVTDELAVAYKGGFTPLARIATAITKVDPVGAGSSYVAGTDYILQDGGLYIPADSAIPAPVSGAANIEVTYTHAASRVVQAFTTSAKSFEALFLGLNEARSGKPVRVRAHKLSGGVMDALQLIGEQHGAGTVTGAAQADTTKALGLSQYFTVEVVE